MIGVSGGGGEPLCAFTVDVDAVELRRLIPPGLGMLSACGPGWLEAAPAVVFGFGGGQYCWWYSGKGFGSVLPFLCGAFANSPSLSGVSGPGESGSGLGAVPRRSASLEGWTDPS